MPPRHNLKPCVTNIFPAAGGEPVATVRTLCRPLDQEFCRKSVARSAQKERIPPGEYVAVMNRVGECFSVPFTAAIPAPPVEVTF